MKPRIPHQARTASAIERVDAQAAIAAGRIRNHPAIALAGTLSEVADQPPMIAIASATLSAGLLLGKPVIARAGGRMLAAHLLATWIKSAIKHRVDRTRPELLVDRDEYRMAQGDSHHHLETSFPSGHTAGIVAVTRALAREVPQATVPGLVLAVAVAGIQVPRCKHYLSDLAAGAAIGLAAEIAVDRLVRRLPA